MAAVAGSNNFAVATENRANDFLLAAAPTEREMVLSRIVGEGCKAVRAFYRGLGSGSFAEGNGYWSVTCADHRSFQVEAHSDGASSVLECTALKAVAHDDCFKKFK
jgi:hypothetical protein